MTSRIGRMHEFHFSSSRYMDATSDERRTGERTGSDRISAVAAETPRARWMVTVSALAAAAVAVLGVASLVRQPQLLPGPESPALTKLWQTEPFVVTAPAAQQIAPASAPTPGAQEQASPDGANATGPVQAIPQPASAEPAAPLESTPSDNPYNKRAPSPATDNPY